MIKMILIIVLAGFVLATNYFAYAKEVPYTLDDRERLIRLETKVEEGFKAVNHRIDGLDKRIDGLDKRIDGLDKRIDGLDKRIDGLQNLIQIVIGGIIALIGFVIWDRRSALAPAIRKNKELEEREELLEKALKEYAKQEPRLAEVLKSLRMI